MKINIIKRLMAVSLSAIMLVGTITMSASAASTAQTANAKFTDVSPDAWYYDAVMAMAEAGVVNGYGDGTFKPDKTITLGEAAAVARRLYGAHICSVDELFWSDSCLDSDNYKPYFYKFGTIKGVYGPSEQYNPNTGQVQSRPMCTTTRMYKTIAKILSKWSTTPSAADRPFPSWSTS